MQVLNVTTEEPKLDFAAAQRLAQAMADELFGESICLAFYDKARDYRSPQNVECHDCGELPGYADYAISRGAALKIVFDNGEAEFYFGKV